MGVSVHMHNSTSALKLYSRTLMQHACPAAPIQGIQAC